jgi:hypothetical protein
MYNTMTKITKFVDNLNTPVPIETFSKLLSTLVKCGFPDDIHELTNNHDHCKYPEDVAWNEYRKFVYLLFGGYLRDEGGKLERCIVNDEMHHLVFGFIYEYTQDDWARTFHKLIPLDLRSSSGKASQREAPLP